MLGTVSEEVVCPNDLDVKGTLKLDGTALSLDGLSDVKAGGTNFTNSLLIGTTTTGTLSAAEHNIGIGTKQFHLYIKYTYILYIERSCLLR